MTETHADRSEYGPLGPGKAPVKDPLKGLAGVNAGVLILEAITILLGLTVILRIDGGQYWTTTNWVVITALGIAHIVASFLQRFPWALKLNLGLQVIGLGTFFIHWSLGVIIIVFIMVWAFMLYLRSMLVERMQRGLLTTQHLGTE